MTTTNTENSEINYKKIAISKGNAYKNSERASVVCAIECGIALNNVKAELNNEFWKNWVKDKMPIGETQCGTFRKLADARDTAWAKSHSSDVLSINCELALIKVEKDKKGDANKADEFRKWANDNKATQADTLAHIKKQMNWGKTPTPLTRKEYADKTNKILDTIVKLVEGNDKQRSPEFVNTIADVNGHVEAIRKALEQDKTA